MGVLVGSGLTVAAQWIVTPRVEARLRAEERWEAALVELHQLLAASPDLMNELCWSWRYTAEKVQETRLKGKEESDPKELRRRERRLNAAFSAWSLHRDRMDLLVRRLHLTSLPLVSEWLDVTAAFPLVFFTPSLLGEPPNYIDEDVERERVGRAAILAAVTHQLEQLDERRPSRDWGGHLELPPPE